MPGGGTCTKGRVVLPILHPSEPSLPEMRDLAASHAAPDARYRVTSVPFRFSSLPDPRPTSCTALRLSSLPIPVCLASAVLVNVSNRYHPRRTSDARFPAPWSLPAAPASPPHTVFSRMKSLSDSFVHVGPAKGETTRLSKLGDRVHQTTTGPAARISRGLLPILVRPRGTRMPVCHSLLARVKSRPRFASVIFEASILLLQNTGLMSLLASDEVLQKRRMAGARSEICGDDIC